MKKIILSLLCVGLFWSCSDDDDAVATGSLIVGTWELQSIIVKPEYREDFNNDGVVDPDLLVELPCYASDILEISETLIVINSTFAEPLVDFAGNYTGDCSAPISETETLSYTFNGNSITTTDSDGFTETVSVVLQGNQLRVLSSDPEDEFEEQVYIKQ